MLVVKELGYSVHVVSSLDAQAFLDVFHVSFQTLIVAVLSVTLLLEAFLLLLTCCNLSMDQALVYHGVRNPYFGVNVAVDSPNFTRFRTTKY